MANNYKLIFTGPSGAGKSTAIASLSDIPVVTTEEKSTDLIPGVYKKTITVALDYGMIRLKNDDKIHLYGTPGQERFNFMWDILTEGGLGLILLLDNARTDPIEDMQFFLKAFAEFIQKTKVVIGVTRTDMAPQPKLKEYHRKLKEMGLNLPIFAVDARSQREVSLLLQALLYSLDPGL
jgi:signal recognition particle receptor subunit beta